MTSKHDSGQDKASFSPELQVENTLRGLERAKRRKSELKSLLEVLQKEYKLVKTEIGLYEGRVEKWMSDKEYSAYLDTLKLDALYESSIPSDQSSTDEK